MSSSSPPDIPPFLATILSSRITSIPPPAPPVSSSTSNPSANPSPILQQPQSQPPNPLYLPPPALPKVEEDLVPPENFALVSKGVYRSGFPKKRNFGFMETLRLKTVLTLVLEDYPEANLEWCQSQDIQFMQFGIPGNKEPFDNIPEDVICSALVAILDQRNHPILIHCNKGKHRTGCLIGCIRRLQSWSLTSIFDEYRRFSSPKSRAVDQQFIDLFDLMPVWKEVTGSSKGGGVGNLPDWGMLSLPRRGVLTPDQNRNQNQIQHEKGKQIPLEAISMSIDDNSPRTGGKANRDWKGDGNDVGNGNENEYKRETGITSLRLDQQQLHLQQTQRRNQRDKISTHDDNINQSSTCTPVSIIVDGEDQSQNSENKSINDIVHLENQKPHQQDQAEEGGIISIDVNVDGIEELKKVDGIIHLTSKVEEVAIN
ncbi:tyrosine specific protein phosphatase [Kwoniella mangroviensis CBS 10435]|uniref:diphosphoinositol-polyphosphate diphosphatase n=1 Tax=Kwoniella mangroviensis CBS 10435 TaxID=1331196 RepID=A0A1B9J334_9TREE|nr:tyrosine specific protein phosphatase [Kwoniella mangroviensis CBS 10435]OCF73250.1 tyrosine specific protein phosphatase [Kwoniella mangroviensis CBS 8886]